MRMKITKLPVGDAERMRTLVIEHADSIEAGFTVLDSRLFLGQATIDVVASDARASLVLMTVGLTADEQMLLRAVEAYSWCLEYPESVRRLYPSIDVSAERPPRIVFVVERAPDSFTRKVKQLGFSEADCVELKHLDVDGTPAVFLDVVARLRRGGLPAPAAAPAAAPTTLSVPETLDDRSGQRRLLRLEAPASAENVIPIANGARATSVKLQKLLHQTGVNGTARDGGTPRPPASGSVTPDLAARVPVVPAGEIAKGETVGAAVLSQEAPQIPEAEGPTERVRPFDIAVTVDAHGSESAVPEHDVADPDTTDPVADSFANMAKDLFAAAAAPAPVVQPPAPVVPPARAKVEPAISIKPSAATPTSPIAARPSPLGVKPAVSRPVAEKCAVPASPAAMKPVVPVPTPATEAVRAPAQPEKRGNLPAELAGLQIPEGALTRQWMEFLNQMAAAK